METLTIKVYFFDELGQEAQELALRDTEERYIRANRCRFYENGIFFDALGLE